jgi:coenzyme PQQ precursor peptide PqqA
LTPSWNRRHHCRTPNFKGETPMAWKTPRIVEIAVGMEINSYACADL